MSKKLSFNKSCDAIRADIDHSDDPAEIAHMLVDFLQGMREESFSADMYTHREVVIRESKLKNGVQKLARDIQRLNVDNS